MTGNALAENDTVNHTSTVVRWYVLVMMVLVYTLSITDRYMISTVLEPIRLEFHKTDSEIADLTGLAMGLFYVTLGFPLSWLIDRSSRRNVIVGSMVVWSAMTVSCAVARNYTQLLIARVGVGVGEAGGTPGANSIISDYFPASRRPMALTIFSLGAPIGAWIALTVAGGIADAHGWRASFTYLGVPGLIVGAIIFITIREPRRGQLDAADAIAKPASFFEAMRFLLTQRSALHLMIGSALTALWGWGLAWWTPTFLTRNYGLSTGAAADVTGDIHLWGGSIATLATGWLMTRPSMADPRNIVRLMGGVIGVCTIVSFGIFYTHSLAVAHALFWIFIPSIYFYIGPCFGILLNLARPGMRAQFCAATLFLANIGNLVVAPKAVGMLSDWFAPNGISDGPSLRLAMLCLVPTGLWATFHYFWSARGTIMIEDQERATGIRIATTQA